MASEAVVSSLVQTMQDCLTSKLEQGFEGQTQLTLDIARELASAVEHKANEYTNIQIDEVKNLIGSPDIDLTPFTEFMHEIKTLIDGNDSVEGYQIFNQLIADTVHNKTRITEHTSTIDSIMVTLTNINTTLEDHANRITALEEALNAVLDCEECHDDFVNIVKNAVGEACESSTGIIDAHHTASSRDHYLDLKDTMGTNGFTMTIELSEDMTNYVIKGTHDSINLSALYFNYEWHSGEIISDWDQLSTLDPDSGEFTIEIPVVELSKQPGKRLSINRRYNNGVQDEMIGWNHDVLVPGEVHTFKLRASSAYGRPGFDATTPDYVAAGEFTDITFTGSEFGRVLRIQMDNPSVYRIRYSFNDNQDVNTVYLGSGVVDRTIGLWTSDWSETANTLTIHADDANRQSLGSTVLSFRNPRESITKTIVATVANEGIYHIDEDYDSSALVLTAKLHAINHSGPEITGVEVWQGGGFLANMVKESDTTYSMVYEDEDVEFVQEEGYSVKILLADGSNIQRVYRSSSALVTGYSRNGPSSIGVNFTDSNLSDFKLVTEFNEIAPIAGPINSTVYFDLRQVQHNSAPYPFIITAVNFQGNRVEIFADMMEFSDLLTPSTYY